MRVSPPTVPACDNLSFTFISGPQFPGWSGACGEPLCGTLCASPLEEQQGGLNMSLAASLCLYCPVTDILPKSPQAALLGVSVGPALSPSHLPLALCPTSFPHFLISFHFISSLGSLLAVLRGLSLEGFRGPRGAGKGDGDSCVQGLKPVHTPSTLQYSGQLYDMAPCCM